jgi:hypothetical protein
MPLPDEEICQLMRSAVLFAAEGFAHLDSCRYPH